jgi:CMP-N-acetylneuraminic acid synthetase
MKVLGVIIARGGSKGIPRKNLADVGGKPLIYYTIDAAQQSRKLTSVIVSTDDEEIAVTSRHFGVDVPFMRPAELGSDQTLTIDVLIHVCHWMIDQGRRYDAVCLLQPTSPQRSGELIDKCIEAFENHLLIR